MLSEFNSMYSGKMPKSHLLDKRCGRPDFEPARDCSLKILSLVCLPFHHARVMFADADNHMMRIHVAGSTFLP